jgi:hypothetical protein
MKNGILSIVAIIIVSCMAFSCSQQKSLQELLQEERKAIDRFVSMNGLVVLKEYPKSGVFKENEYFRTVDGLFFNVVDSGNGVRVENRSVVTVRYDHLQYIKDAARGDTTKYFPNPYLPVSFTFGIPQTYSSRSTSVSVAWVIPLEFVGAGAVINLIIPSSLGSVMDNNNVAPVFIRNLRYTSVYGIN